MKLLMVIVFVIILLFLFFIKKGIELRKKYLGKITEIEANWHSYKYVNHLLYLLLVNLVHLELQQLVMQLIVLLCF